ncbi:Hypothetical protein A7982_05232 [Minicystis rosea]|nr:Hypothetical protein A7982_05232 [Minicystis rosea]
MGSTVCFVITAHGYGHGSRQMEVVRTLLRRRPERSAVVFTATPELVFRDYLDADPSVSARTSVVPFRADVGLVQRDGLTMDHEATLRALADAWSDPDRAEASLAAALAAHRPAVVVADIPPVALGAAHRIGVPSVAVGNFDWAAIYAYYAAKNPAFTPYEQLCRRWQALATTAVSLAPGLPLTGFARVISAEPLARDLLVDPRAVRARLDVPAGDRAVLVSFGGFGLDDPHRRIPRIPGITWILAPPMEDLRRSDTRFAPHEPYLGLLAACDAVFTKPGYGIVCEATRNRTRVLYTDRGDFPEYPSLVRWLEENAPSAYVPSAVLGSEDGPEAVRNAIETLFARPERWPDRWGGAGQIVDAIERLLATG